MPYLLEEVTTSMKRWKALHLSWAGKEAVLNCYLRPKYLYQLTVVPADTHSFVIHEKWFLSSSSDFDENRRYKFPLSNSKMKSKVTRLRLRPLEDQLMDRRTILLIKLAHSKAHFLHGALNGKRLAQLMRFSPPLAIFSKCAPPKASTLQSALNKYKTRVAHAEMKPPKWSPGQEELMNRHGMHWPTLFALMRKIRCRVAVLSFGWKLLNRIVHPSFKVTICPLCNSGLSTRHILDAECSYLTMDKGAYSRILTPPHNNLLQDLITTWSIWKVWCSYTHSHFTTTPPQSWFLNSFKINLMSESKRLF